MTDLLLKSKNKVSFVKFFKAESFPLARYIIQLWHLGKESDLSLGFSYLCAGSDLIGHCPDGSTSSGLSTAEEKRGAGLKILKPPVNHGIGTDGVERVFRSRVVNRESCCL